MESICVVLLVERGKNIEKPHILNKFDNISMMLTSLIVMLLFPWIHGSAQKCRQAYSQKNLELQGHMIKSLPRSESFQCVDACASHGKCHSINFYQDKRICELNDANHLSNPESLVYSHGSQYLNYFKRPVAKCSNKLCSEPLACQVDDGGLNYKCVVIEVLNFPRKSVDDKVVLVHPFYNLTAFTVALWVQADPRTNDHTPFSYAINNTYPESDDEKENEITFFLKKNKTNIAIGNSVFDFPSSIVDGKWHHISLTWENIQGTYKIYIDGAMRKEGSKHIGRVITKGAIVLGQDQDDYLGKFSVSQSLQGDLTSVNMWDKVLTAQDISDLAKSCTAGEGNVVKWSDLKDKGEGAVKLIRVSECGRSL